MSALSSLPSGEIDAPFRVRIWEHETARSTTGRDEYERDRARIIHSAAFRRLQAKTQILGVGEGDFHRTRLTHSIEVAQVGEGIANNLRRRYSGDAEILGWLPSNELIGAACYAHDLGHPPFGHGGERALQSEMVHNGGFEGNAQTLRILTRLEPYKEGQGLNPTKRLVLAVLKYPVPYSYFINTFTSEKYLAKPPKCYYDSEKEVVESAARLLGPEDEVLRFTTELKDGKPAHRTLDASIMEMADDIAYGVHDLEDIALKGLTLPGNFEAQFYSQFGTGSAFGGDQEGGKVSGEMIACDLFSSSPSKRKNVIGKLVHLFIANIAVVERIGFSHPLARYRCELPAELQALLEFLKGYPFEAVIMQPSVQHLERRGEWAVKRVFKALIEKPTSMVPEPYYSKCQENQDLNRSVSDYIASMTDPFCEKIYHRLYVPGFGSSRDEI